MIKDDPVLVGFVNFCIHEPESQDDHIAAARLLGKDGRNKMEVMLDYIKAVVVFAEWAETFEKREV